MGIMTVKDASEVKDLNRRQRNKMAVGKEGLQVTEVMIQEGVPTVERVAAGTAEPVVYMIDRYLDLHEAAAAGSLDQAQAPDAPPNRFYAYGVVARLALLAAAVELERSEANPTIYP